VIEARGLQKIYRNGQNEIRPLDGIDFTCERGEFVLVTGRSGSGKTTFLNVLAGLTLPTAGSVKIAGRDLLALTDHERSVLRSEMMGFVFQFPGLMAHGHGERPAARHTQGQA
jgi:putative ABC transport system ATP-binding protein